MLQPLTESRRFCPLDSACGRDIGMHIARHLAGFADRRRDDEF
jgi:hypothetical protein